MSPDTQLLETCKELFEVVTACFRVIDRYGGVIDNEGSSTIDAIEAELKRCGIKGGFGLRAQLAIEKAEGGPNEERARPYSR